MIKRVFLGLIFLLCLVPAASAQDPEALRGQANAHVMTASRMMETAFQSLQRNPTPEGRNTAIALLVEAGQLFEQAAGIYQTLAPNYGTAGDAENAQRAMVACIQKIQEIKQLR